ncbi:translation initiation factor eIF-2B subunit delta [Leptidea sinapis]|uniref:translation initiation factor eIF-2B subunit delta n=1 Tax=Leptidea sinapis TaxID=189913 RepID=UPI002144CE75|nr:translation initiation factor eIF-2B subunit delta [Leptidea sinapis]
MSDPSAKSREEVLAAREAKKLAKMKAKKKEIGDTKVDKSQCSKDAQKVDNQPTKSKTIREDKPKYSASTVDKVRNIKSKDEVDRAEIQHLEDSLKTFKQLKPEKSENEGVKINENLTVTDVVNTLRDIVNVAKDVENVTALVHAMDVNKPNEEEKSKAQLKAERRAKQEAQRAAKQAQQKQEALPEQKPKEAKETSIAKDISKEKSPKPKTLERPKLKSHGTCNWFQHLCTQVDAESLNQMALNSNLHPAVIKLGIQLSSHVITGANARCIALLDALKKMVRDYSLPARTEFARGLEAQLASSTKYLWSARAPAASELNALKHFRHHLTQLPNNVDEFDAKKTLQEEIDRYIREQIDMAGEAISITVRNKISNGDNILTYGYCSLIERILREAHLSGVKYRAVIVGTRLDRGGTEMLRRLSVCGVTCTYVDISALSFVMNTIDKVVVGAESLLVTGAVVATAGTLQTSLVARAHNVPVLVACETHKFTERVQYDAFVYNEIGDPEALIDKTDGNSPLKDWHSNPNLTLLNLAYDVTPPSLVTAVVTELAILPCTSAPVVLRFKSSEYGL